VTGGRAAAALAAVVLAACAAVPRTAERPPGDSLSGRLALRVETASGTEARSMTAAFELQGRPEAGELNLSTPLGTVLGQARWTPGSVVLVTPQGSTSYPNLDVLTREILGESLPVAALFDWLKGRPWPGAPSRVATAPAGPGFSQLGWSVDLASFGDAAIAAVREQAPTVTVRVKLDRP
jgi:outer membrane lipoprotein LolB